MNTPNAPHTGSVSEAAPASELTPQAIGLVRVSTERQDTDRQIQAIETYCKLENYHLSKIIEEQPGTSGRNPAVRKGGIEATGYYNELISSLSPETGRPGLTAAIHAMRTNQCSILVIYALDRLSRDATELLLLQRIAEAHGITLAVVNAGGALEASTASGWLQFAMQAILAEHECRQIAERTSSSLKAKSAAWNAGDRTGPHVGRPPVGWQRDPTGPGYIHDPDRWPTVQRVHQLRNAGNTYKQISEQTGIPQSSVKSYIDAATWQQPDTTK